MQFVVLQFAPFHIYNIFIIMLISDYNVFICLNTYNNAGYEE